MLVVVGMGRNPKDLTLSGKETIGKAKYVVVKSCKTHAAKAVAQIRSDALYCDDLYETSENFDILNDSIAARLSDCSEKGLTAFCVVGDGADDSTVAALAAKGVPFTANAGVGLHSAVTDRFFAEGTRVYSACSFVSEKVILPLPTVIKSIDDRLTAGDVRLRLTEAFDSDTPVTYCDGKTVRQISLADLDKQKFGYASALYITPKKTESKEVFGYYDAVEILRTLRGENGCPWDRVQTHKSLEKNVIEEAYELVNAVESGDKNNLTEELGDLLMQVLFHMEIAADEGEFAEEAVYTALCRKLIDRHPHVFGSLNAGSSDEALSNWEKAKQKEHKLKNLTENLLDVPAGLSALMRAYKLQYRASKSGYDFADVGQCLAKLKEETEEFLAARNEDEKSSEGGDLLFAVVNLLRLNNTEPETALLNASDKFMKRVIFAEKLLGGRSVSELSPAEFDAIWEEAKKNDR